MKKTVAGLLPALALTVPALLAAQAAKAQKQDEIVLGAAMSLTGVYATEGNHARNGYDLAIERINAGGGVEIDGRSYQLRIVYYDDKSDPKQAAMLAEKLIDEDGVKFILGPYSSTITKAMAQVTERHGIPMIEANGASRSLFTQGHRYLFAILSSAEQYLESAVDLAAEKAPDLGKKPADLRLALAFENDAFSQDVRLGVLAAAKRHGMTVVIDDKLPDSLDDMAATLNKVKAQKPDMLLVSGHAKGAATAARQMEQLKVDVPILAMTHCGSARIHVEHPAGSAYTLCALQWQKHLTYQDDDGLFGSGEDFARIFKKRFGYEPPYQAAESAAAVQVWADAFRRGQTLDPQRLRDVIAKTGLQTFYGNVRFNEAGQNIAKPMVLSQIVDGEFKVVYPTEWATSQAVVPRPDWGAR